jgi:hypothetical protein
MYIAWQSNPDCVAQEQQSLATRTKPVFECSFEPPTPLFEAVHDKRPIVATVREEGRSASAFK